MLIFVIFCYFFITSPFNQPNSKIFYGKKFPYEVYCKERIGFYTLELRLQGSKYHSIEQLSILKSKKIHTIDTLARNQYQSIVNCKSSKLLYVDTRWGKCELEEVVETTIIKQRRLTLFYNALTTQLENIKKNKNINVKIPQSYRDVIDDFAEYDKTGVVQITFVTRSSLGPQFCVGSIFTMSEGGHILGMGEILEILNN